MLVINLLNVVVVVGCLPVSQKYRTRAKAKMAALRLTRDFSKVLLSTSAVCNCGLPCSRSFFTLMKNGRKVMLPDRVLKVARYYEKPKEKKGPSTGSWAFLAGATTGIIVGAIAYFGTLHRYLCSFAYLL